ncbi:MAG: hypothetical protein H7328_11905 [Bdellovibrio sp.]|nr:hypothetical protein [Bdellovibrio sp.]
MNCRAKTLYPFLVLTSIFFANSAIADAPSEQSVSWNRISSTKIEIEDFSSGQGQILSTYPRILQTLLNEVFGWEPDKQPKISTPPVIERNTTFFMQELMQNLSIKFDLSDTQHFRKVWFHLKPDLKVRGLFGIQDFQKKRPLIIIRMGIHGNVDEVLAERFLAKVVYEDLGANFLLLENLTSYAFVSQNQNLSFGGIDEGLQTFLILNEITKINSPFKNLLSDIHLIGLSMGGTGTFVTALLDQSNGKKIKSIVDFCPLINLEKTFDAHAQTGISQALIDLWNARRLNTVFDRYPKEMKDSQWWKTIFDLKPRFTPALLDILNRDRKQPLTSVADVEAEVKTMKWPKGFSEHLQNSKSFYELNDFWPLYQGVTTPISIVVTPKDPLVINEFNSEMIYTKKQPGDFTSVNYHIYDRGIHCGFSPVYQWSYVVDLVRKGLALTP